MADERDDDTSLGGDAAPEAPPQKDQKKEKAREKKKAASVAAEMDPLANVKQMVEGALIPSMYQVWPEGVFEIKPPMQRVEQPAGEEPPTPNLEKGTKLPPWWRVNLELVIARPLAVVGRGEVTDAARSMVELWYLDDFYAPRKRWVERSEVADTSPLIKLSSHGIPINRGNVFKVMMYLGACLLTNHAMRAQLFAHRFGYHEIADREVQGWLLGDNWIGSDRGMRADPRGGHPLADAFTQRGNFDRWRAFIEPYLTDPQRRFLMGAAFGSVLIRHLGWRPVTFHHYGGTTGGKTTWAQATLTPFADPNIMMRTLDATTISTGAIYRHMDDFPTLFDESMTSTVDLAKLIYNQGSGQNRSRAIDTGDLQGGRPRHHSVMRTTGEYSLTFGTTDAGGQDSRCIQLQVPDAQKKDTDLAVKCQEFFNEGHWGWAGPRFLRELYPVIADPERKEKLIAKFRALRDDRLVEHLTKHFPDATYGQIVNRAGHIACAALGECYMLHWVFEWDAALAFQTALQDALHCAEESVSPDDFAPLKERVMTFLRDHFSSNGHQYVDLDMPDGWEELRRRRRQTTVVGLKKEDEIWYYPSVIDEVLKKHGWDPKRVWKDLAKEPPRKDPDKPELAVLFTEGRHLQRFRQMNQAGIQRQRMYVVRRSKLFPPDPTQAHAAPPPSTPDVDLYDAPADDLGLDEDTSTDDLLDDLGLDGASTPDAAIDEAPNADPDADDAPPLDL